MRRAGSGDVPTLVELWEEMSAVQAAADPRMQTSPMAAAVLNGWFEDHLVGDRSAVFVAEEEGGGIVGYAFGTILENRPFYPDQFCGYFADLSIRASERRTGIGTRLAREMHEWFRSRQLPYVLVNVSALNAGAGAFWRRQGYGEFVENLRMDL